MDDEFDFSEVQFLQGSAIPDDVCINASYSHSLYPHIFCMEVGRKENKTFCKISTDYINSNWDERVNLKHFLKGFEKEVRRHDKYDVEMVLDESGEGGFLIISFFLPQDLVLKDSIDEACKFLSSCHNIVLLGFNDEDAFISQFRFPKEYKSSFLQYLTYFGQFLEDLGISGDLSISDKADVTYLMFYPENKEMALGNITTALSAYLSIPDKDNVNLISCRDDLESQVRYQQLSSVVNHLKSQLELSRAVISLKEKEISLLEDRELKLKSNRLRGDIKNYWEPFDGVKITSYKGKCFEIDIPKIVNNIFGKLEKK
ncbi:hypothetical protein B6S09_16100 [Oceanimonas baumannii]|nr:hypothetical protein B6S09_16100 [Oceanimonas baumannii]